MSSSTHQRPPQPTSSSQAPPPSSFQPFFTLISPTPTNPSHAHPHVHYIFADDATDPTLDLPPNARDRIITVDIDFDAEHGAFVKEAHSLSRDFQLIEATVKEAPQMLGVGEEGGVGGAGFMLSIEGVEGGLRGVKASGGVQELAQVFAERMAMLRRVVEFGGGFPVEYEGGELLNRGEETADETVTEEDTSAEEGSFGP